MYQAGIKNITLYENKGISFLYSDPNDLTIINSLKTTGTILYITNDQMPEFEYQHKLSDSGKLTFDYNIKFYFLGISSDTANKILTLVNSIRGWCFLVELYDGTKKYFNVPLFCKNTKINVHKEMSYEVEMKTATPSVQDWLELEQEAPDYVPVYRADTTLLTTDTTIYTSDYEL